ncbi:hypothetical protein ACFQZO_18370 [Bradyrhizobium sp. GCM10027634]|nr:MULTISPECIES: hypothetical protein [Bradyrhizobium]
MKMRNIAGDRVVHAPDFFSEHNVPIDVREFAAEWSSADQALIIAHAFDL